MSAFEEAFPRLRILHLHANHTTQPGLLPYAQEMTSLQALDFTPDPNPLESLGVTQVLELFPEVSFYCSGLSV